MAVGAGVMGEGMSVVGYKCGCGCVHAYVPTYIGDRLCVCVCLCVCVHACPCMCWQSVVVWC